MTYCLHEYQHVCTDSKESGCTTLSVHTYAANIFMACANITKAYIHIYVYLYIYIIFHISICISIYVYVCMYIYIYIYT